MMSFRHPPPPHLLAPISLCVRTHTHARHARAGVQVYVRACVRTCVRRYVRTNVRTYVTRRVGMMSFRHPPPPHLLSPLSLCARACARTCVGMHARHARADVQVYVRTCVRRYVRAYVRRYVRTYVFVRTYVRTYLRTYVRVSRASPRCTEQRHCDDRGEGEPPSKKSKKRKEAGPIEDGNKEQQLTWQFRPS